mgnify:CR=1 FL=1
MPDIGQLVIILSILLVSLTVHELAHAATADWLGDPTARRLGRVSLNPLVHLDPVGSFLLPLMMSVVSPGFIFGWAKPVPVSTANLKNGRRDFLVIAAAGPASNIVLAASASVLLGLGLLPSGFGEAPGMPGAVELFVYLNLLLAVFNMVPIPPLDGGNVLAGLLPEALAAGYDRVVRPFGFVILIVLMYTGWLYRLINPPLSALANLMGWLQP